MEDDAQLGQVHIPAVHVETRQQVIPGTLRSHGSTFAARVAAGVTGSAVRLAMGGKVDATTAIVDAFGNAIGNSIVDRMTLTQIGLTADQYADMDRQISSAVGNTQDSLNFEVRTGALLGMNLSNNPNAFANVGMPAPSFASEVPARSAATKASQIASTAGFYEQFRAAQALADPLTGRRIGPTVENAVAMGLAEQKATIPKIDYAQGREMRPWDGKTESQSAGLDDVRAGTWHYRQSGNLSSALPALSVGGAYSLGARFVASQLAKVPLVELGTTELLKGMAGSGTLSAVIYGAVRQEESTPAGVAVAFGSGALGAGVVKQGMNFWAGLPNTAFPVSWSNAVTQATGSAYGFSVFGVWNLADVTAAGESWWTKPIAVPVLPNSLSDK